MIQDRQKIKLLEYALKILEGGVSIIAVGSDKRPYFSWLQYQKNRCSSAEVQRWILDSKTTGFAMIGGAVSGGLEIIDFDEDGYFEAFKAALEPALFGRLAVQRTGGGGYQVGYRAPVAAKNSKLAWEPRAGERDGRVIAIETRGEGGYALIPESLHPSGNIYKLLEGDFAALSTLEQNEVDTIWATARGLCQMPVGLLEQERLRRSAEHRQQARSGPRAMGEGQSPIDAYNAQNHISTTLERYGYTPFGNRYTRPGDGATLGGVVLLTNHSDLLCSYHHSSNDPLSDGHLHDAFDVFCFNEFGGDFRAGVRAAAEQLGMAYPARPLPAGPNTHTLESILDLVDIPPPSEEGATVDNKKDEKDKITLVEYRELFFANSSTKYVYYTPSDTWYEYQHGVYVLLQDKTMMQRVDQVMQKLGFLNQKTALTKEIMAKISYEVARGNYDLGPFQMNCKNGILNLKTRTLEPHDPAFFSIVQCDVFYDPEAWCEEFQDVLAMMLPTKNDQQILVRFFGYCLTGDNNAQKSLMLMGEAGTGKGTMLRILSALMGKLATAMPMETLATDRFAASSLQGARMVVLSEIDKGVDWKQFKRITGQDRIRIEQKHKDAYDEELHCKFVILSNNLPRLGEDKNNDSVTRRVIPLRFNVQPSAPDPLLTSRLTTEAAKSGILNLLIAGLENYWHAGTFGIESNDLKKEMVSRGNPVIAWLEEEGSFKANAELSIQDAYAGWVQYAETNGFHAGGKINFTDNFLAACKFLDWPVQKTRVGSIKRYWAFVGVAL